MPKRTLLEAALRLGGIEAVSMGCKTSIASRRYGWGLDIVLCSIESSYSVAHHPDHSSEPYYSVIGLYSPMKRPCRVSALFGLELGFGVLGFGSGLS